MIRTAFRHEPERVDRSLSSIRPHAVSGISGRFLRCHDGMSARLADRIRLLDKPCRSWGGLSADPGMAIKLDLDSEADLSLFHKCATLSLFHKCATWSVNVGVTGRGRWERI